MSRLRNPRSIANNVSAPIPLGYQLGTINAEQTFEAACGNIAAWMLRFKCTRLALNQIEKLTAGGLRMLPKLKDNIRYFFRDISRVTLRRRQIKVAEMGKREREERRALVDKLISTFNAAHEACKKDKKGVAAVELSLQEVAFIELNLKSWARTLRESEIFEVSR